MYLYMHYHWVSLAIQVIALIALIVYAWDTRRIKKASQEQAESAQKPCLVLVTDSRDFDETVLETNGAAGGAVIAPRNGNVALQNVGNGPALNVSYDFRPLDPSNISRPHGYLPNIMVGKSLVLAVPRGILDAQDYEVVFQYDSMSRQRYQSRIVITKKVVTAFRFGPATSGISTTS
jgi:hypothetical protein